MPADKPRATVTLSAKAAAAIEDKLRDAMVHSTVINLIDDLKVRKKKQKVQVQLDPSVVARFTEHLRQALVASECINLAEANEADKATGKLKQQKPSRAAR